MAGNILRGGSHNHPTGVALKSMKGGSEHGKSNYIR